MSEERYYKVFVHESWDINLIMQWLDENLLPEKDKDDDVNMVNIMHVEDGMDFIFRDKNRALMFKLGCLPK